MGKARVGMRLLGVALLWSGTGYAAQAAAPTAAQMLGLKPKQENIVCSTPAGETELSACKVELIKGTGNASGWLLRDGQGQPVRRFFDTNGDKQIDIYSYYLDGQEVYREIDSNFNGKVDQYRWLNSGGMRWGVSSQENGKIDSWKAISPEETSQEILKAVISRDLARLQALMVTEADIKSLELPASEAGRIREALAAVPEKFRKTTAELIKLDEKTRWMHLEIGAPQCIPADVLGGQRDLIRHPQGTILYNMGDKHDWLQTGELILVGRTWKVVSGPTPGYGAPEDPRIKQNATALTVSEEIKGELEALKTLDAAAPKPGSSSERIVTYNLERARILERIVAKVKPEQREQWVKQVADCLGAAAQNSRPNDRAPYDRLVALREQVAKSAPGSSLAAYIAFREMSAEYARKLAAGATGSEKIDMAKLQSEWRDRLKKFVDEYPTADDTADALMQLGMVCEFIGEETQARNYYTLLAKNFAKSPLAAKANGALRRLTLDGKPLELSAPTLGGGSPFDVSKLSGKVVVVYYWASWNGQCVNDFAKLKSILNTHGSKGVELVCVNLDNTQGDAINFLNRTPAPGTHLFLPGGLDSPLATQYGVLVLPNLFLVGKDGKVVSRSVQIGTLEDEVTKLLK